MSPHRRPAGLALYLLLLAPVLAAGTRVAPAAEAGAADPLTESQNHFAHGRYRDGRWALVRALKSGDLAPGRRLELLLALADFWENLAGRPDEAVVALERAAALELPAGNAARQRIAGRIRRLRSIPERFPEEDAVLARAAVRTFKPEKMLLRVEELRGVLERSPEYPRRAWLFYYLGQNLQGLERDLEAYSAFRAALRLRPGLGYCVPVERCLEEAGEAAARQSVRRGVFWTLFLLLLLGGSSFYLSRPWRWLRPVHLLLPLAATGIWWAFLAVSSRAVAGLADSGAGNFSRPVFMSTSMGAPGGEMLHDLLACGVVAVAGCFVLACGATLIRPRWLRAAVTGLAGLLLWTALLTAFFLERVDGRSILEAGGGAGARLRAVAYFDQEAVEPYVLTAPKSFPGMDARTIHHDPVLQAWVLKHVPGALGAEEDARR